MINNISKIKYHNDKLLVDFISQETVQKEFTFDTSSRSIFEKPPHPDFRKKWERLAFHFAAIMEYISDADAKKEFKGGAIVKWAEENRFNITSLHLSGEDEKAGFILTGSKTLSSGKVSTFNTPFLRFADIEHYLIMGELEEEIEAILEEVRAYIQDGKCAPKEQLELFTKKGEKDDLDEDEDAGHNIVSMTGT